MTYKKMCTNDDTFSIARLLSIFQCTFDIILFSLYRGAVLVCALPWLKSVLRQHASSIALQESSLRILNSLYQVRFSLSKYCFISFNWNCIKTYKIYFTSASWLIMVEHNTVLKMGLCNFSPYLSWSSWLKSRTLLFISFIFSVFKFPLFKVAILQFTGGDHLK